MPPVANCSKVDYAVLFTIGSRFLTVWPLLAISGAGHRTGFIASLNLAQVSEFGIEGVELLSELSVAVAQRDDLHDHPER